MSIPHYATIDGTLEFAQKFHGQFSDSAFNLFGRTGLRVSQIGFGTYRCHIGIPEHQEALKAALQKGCNLVDTSANYTDGNAEVLIGDVLNQELVWGEMQRGNLVVVSKVGYIQGENMQIARDREEEGSPFPEVVKYQSELWHCIHPHFIEDQITRSLARMHLDTLDIYLLHNPEYFLSHANRQRFTDTETTTSEFYKRIHQAFAKLEQLVNEGLIRWYGISSNSFPLPEDSQEFVSLAQVWDVYEKACQDIGKAPEEGHFAAIQLPFNWIEHQGATLKNNEYRGKKYTVLELAQKLNLGVMINRPLNAILDGRILLRLARYRFKEGVDYRRQFPDEQNYQQVKHLEQRFDAAYPKQAPTLTFSQKALLLAASVSGIDVVLNGMRTPEYVADSMKVMEISEDVSLEKLLPALK